MNTKRLITASIFSLISASTALAADVIIPHQPASSTSSTIIAPTFSWTGLYLGVQAGGFSSKADMALVGQEKSLPLDKEFSPKLSGFAGGFYAGSNIDLGDNFIFGVDTDLMISGKKHTKTITIGAADNTTVENAVVRSRRSAETPASASTVSQTLSSQSQVSGKSAAPKPAEGKVQKLQGEASTNANPKTTENTVSSTTPQTLPNSTIDTSAQGSESAKIVSGASSVRSTPTAELKAKVQLVPSSLARSDTGETLVSRVSESKPVSLKPASSNPEAGAPEQSKSLVLAKSATGEQPSKVGRSGSSVSVQSMPVQPAVTKQIPSIPSTGSESSKPAEKTPTSVQLSAVERTVSSAPLVLARSRSSSGSETNASNGTSGAQRGGYHSSSHGSGNANPHGAPHAAGHGSGAHAHGSNPHASSSHGGQNMAGHGAQNTQAVDKNDSSVYGIEQIKKMASELGLDQEYEVETLSHTFKQNWGGATRVRIGFAADRFMPYLAGGIAYGQFQDTVSISVKDEDGRVVSSKNLADETKTMIGYTLGGGVDFSLLDNVIVRAEYRYSDFGKKKFAKEKLEVNYKTNDFRVGVAYKF
ncbi:MULTISPECIES: outer membrane beta-barrel protein [unclassified Bartonella]|uniref:outer membrane beta-barrel protein n=1 Tax=unclassified Bartonella TaxID=2645622 RepID=UPI0035CEEAF0